MTSAGRGNASTLARADVLLRRVELALARRVTGQLPGAHVGVGTAMVGAELASARIYVPGVDDVRFMDWPVTARTGTPHVREQVPERDLSTVVLVDGSASMSFGTTTWTKRELAAAAVAGIAVLTDRPGNRLSACLVGAGPTPRRFPPRYGRRGQLQLLSSLLEQADGPAAPGPTRRSRRLARRRADQDPAATAVPSLADGIRAAARQAPRPGLLVVVSDFLDPEVEQWGGQLRRAAVRHEVVAVEVSDPREHELVDIGTVNVADPETGAALTIDTSDAAFRDMYATVAAEHAQAVGAAIRRAPARLVRISTGSDWVVELARALDAASRPGAARSALARRVPA